MRQSFIKITAALQAVMLSAAVFGGGFALAENGEAAPVSTVDGFLDAEIEDMPYDEAYFEKISAEMYSGGCALKPTSEDKTVPGAKEPAQLDLSFTADKAGTYQIWVRHSSEIVNQRGQSVFVSLGGASYGNFRLTGESKDPVWVKLGSLSVKEGAVGSVRLRRRQQVDIGFDRYIVTRDASYVPDDTVLGIKEPRPEAVTFETKSGQLEFEAEDMTVYNNFSVFSNFKMSGGVGLQNSVAMSESILAGNEADAAVNIKCDQSGTYYIWAYMRGNSSANRTGISLNGGDYSIISTAKSNLFSWSKLLAVPSVNKGDVINIRLRGCRGKTYIDKICVVNDLLQQPYGLVGSLIKKDTTVDVLDDYRADVKKPEGHPRLYFKSSDIEGILAGKDKEQNVYAWAAQAENVRAGLEDSFTGKLTAPDAGKSNYDAQKAAYIESLAFDYAVYGNEESGKKAVSAMNNYLNSVVFIGAGGDTYVRAAGQLIFHASEVYDWCYPLMDNATREYFIERIIEIAGDGLEVGWPFSGNGVTGHASEAQLQRDLLAFAIAVADERPDVFDRMMSVLYKNYVPARKFVYESLMPNQGSQYGLYRGQWELNAAFIMDRLGIPGFYGENQRYFPYYFLYARRPDGIIMRDGDARTDGNTVGAFQTRPDNSRVMMFASSLYKDGYLKDEFNRQFGFGKSLSYGHGNITPVEFICAYDAELETKNRKDLPLTRYFPSPRGAMIARTGWTDGIDSPDAVAYMNVEEYNFGNHDHIDAGHFQIYYKGILANDAGSYISYGSAHDRGYYKRSVAHNTMAVRNPEKPVTFQGYTTYDGGQRSPRNGADGGMDVFETDEYRFGYVLGHEAGEDKYAPEYSYLSGNITRAYYPETVENYERSFMFYDLKDADHPAAMIVFDRITSANPAFEKAWLLNGPTEPSFENNRTVFINNENGYNGRMTVDTLLPAADNTKAEIIGGEGQDAFSGGVNYSADAALDPGLTHEAVGYRIEISPKKAEAKDLFLNVIQVGDAEGGAQPYTPKLIENATCAGAVLGGEVTVFKTGYGRSDKEVSFALDAGEYRIHIADNIAGEWTVYKDGAVLTKAYASAEGGVLSFFGGGGSYRAVYSGGAAVGDADEAAASQEPDPDAEAAAPPQQTEYLNDVDVKIYNSYLYTPVMGKKLGGNVFVPLRAVAEKLGGEVSWENGAAVVKFGKSRLALTEGSDTVTVNGNTESLPYAPVIYDEATLVPPQFFAAYMYCEWTYDDFMHCVRFKNYQRGTAEDRNGDLYFPTEHGLKDELRIYAVLQSGSDGNDITNTLDGDFDNRWAVQGTAKSPSWGIFDLGSVKQLDKLYIAYYQGASRRAYFRVEVSVDGEEYTAVIPEGTSSGDTDSFEEFDLGGIKGRYIKIYGMGNDSSASASWNSIAELAVTGR